MEEGSNTRAGFVSAKSKSEWRDKRNEMRGRENKLRKIEGKILVLILCLQSCLPTTLTTLFPTVYFSSKGQIDSCLAKVAMGLPLPATKG